MTIVKRRTKIIIILATILAFSLCMIFYINKTDANASEIVLSGEMLFPKVTTTPVNIVQHDSVDDTYSITTSEDFGVSLTCTTVAASTNNNVTKFVYEYHKAIRPNGLNETNQFSLTLGFDSNWRTNGYSSNDSLSVILRFSTGNYIEWRFQKNYTTYKTGVMYTYNASGALLNTSSSQYIATDRASLTVGYRRVGTNNQLFIDGTGTGAIPQLTNWNINGTDPNGGLAATSEATLIIQQIKSGNMTTPSYRTMTTYLQALSGVSLLDGTTVAGVLDTAVPSATATYDKSKADIDGSVFGNGTGQAGSSSIRLNYDSDVGIRFSVDEAYDIFTGYNEMLFVVKDTFVTDYNSDPKNTTYTWRQESFAFGSKYFDYIPKQLYGNVLPIGDHIISVGILKPNGESVFVDFNVAIVTRSDNFIIRPSINKGVVPIEIEYGSLITVNPYTAADLSGTPLPVDFKILDPAGKFVEQGGTFTPTMLGKHHYIYSTTDKFGTTASDYIEVNCVKTTSPTKIDGTTATKPGIEAVNTIYYKENTVELLLSAEEAKSVLFNDVIQQELKIEIAVLRLNGAIYESFASSHSFVVNDSTSYRIIYKAKDVAWTESKPTAHYAEVSFDLVVVNRMEIPVFVNLNNFSIPKQFLFYPAELYPVATPNLPDIGDYIADFDNLRDPHYFVNNPASVSMSMRDPDNVKIENEEIFNPSTRAFRPMREGTYIAEYTVVNSAGRQATATFAIIVYSFTPSYNSTELNRYENDYLPKKIALNEGGALPLSLPQSVVDDGYKTLNALNVISFSCKIFNNAGEDVTDSIVGGVFTPRSEGWHRIIYRATNIAGKYVETIFYVQVFVPVPEFRNPQELNMPESAAYFLDYSAERNTKIPKFTKAAITTGYLSSKNILWDYYGLSKINLELTVRKQNAAGAMVAINQSELVDAADGVNWLFMPMQKGIYTFTYTASNEGGGSATLVYTVIVVAHPPQINQSAIGAFKTAMSQNVLLYKNYTGLNTKIIPRFEPATYLVDVDGDNYKSVVVSITVSRPDAGAITDEWNVSSHAFKPKIEGGYIFAYTVTGGSGESISFSYTVNVIAYYPSFQHLSSFVLPTSVKSGEEVRIDPMTAYYVQDSYNSITDSSIVLTITSTKTSTKGNANGEYRYSESKGFWVFCPTYKGPYEFKYSVENAGGKVAEIVYTIFVTIEPPVIEFRINNSVVTDFWEKNKTVHCGDEITMPSASAFDEMGEKITGASFTATYERPQAVGNLTWTLTQSTLKFSTIGDYTFRYVAVDTTGNERVLIYAIKCIDIDAPNINIIDKIDGVVFNIGNEFVESNPTHYVTLRGYGSGWTAVDVGHNGTLEGSGINTTTAKLTISRIGDAKNWTSDANGGYEIKLIPENEGTYTAVYTVQDRAGNQTSRYTTFIIKLPPRVIPPSLPTEILGNSTLQLTVPKLDYADATFNIFCQVIDPDGVGDSRNDAIMTNTRNIVLSKPGKYKISYFTKNTTGIESTHEVFEINSLRGSPIFNEVSRQNMLTAIANYLTSDNGLSAGNTQYPFPSLVATDVFGDETNYVVKISMDYHNGDAPQTQIFEPEADGRYMLRFRAESIYKLTFVICYAGGEPNVLNPVLDDKGNMITFSDMLRVSGNGGIEFRYQDRFVKDFFDPATAPGNFATNIRGTTLFAMPAKKPEFGKSSLKITFLKITAKGRINGQDTYPSVLIYIFGPGSTIDDEGLRFMDSLPVDNDPNVAAPTFTAYEIGWYTIIYEARDDVGNILRIQYKLEIRDETPPEFTNLEAFTAVLQDKTKSSEVNKNLVFPMPDIIDNYDPVNILRVTVEIKEPSGNRFSLDNYKFTPMFDGQHKVLYTIWDNSDRATEFEFSFTVIPEVPPETPILGIAIGGIAGLTLMAGAVYLLVYKNIFRIRKLIPKNN